MPNKVDRQHNDYTGQVASYEAKRFEGRHNQYLEILRCRAVRKAFAGLPRDALVLDVGCGTGRGIRYLASEGFYRITGLDYTAAMLDVARNHVRNLSSSAIVQLVQGDGFALPVPDRSIDVVLSLNFLHMFRFDLQQQLVQEMARVCRPGGRLVLEFESIHKGLFFTRYFEQQRLKHRTKFNSVWEIRRLFPKARFTSVRVFGTALPKLYRLFSRFPSVGMTVESVTLAPPFNWLAERVVVAAERR